MGSGNKDRRMTAITCKGGRAQGIRGFEIEVYTRGGNRSRNR